MQKRKVVPVLLLALSAGICAAQSKDDVKVKPEATFYRLDLAVKEIDAGRVTNSRTFSTIGSTEREQPPSVRAGSKIPFVRASGELGYTDVGVNVDYRALKDLGDSLSVIVSVDVSSVAGNESTSASDRVPPVIRQNRWSALAIIPVRKPTVIFSSDDVTSRGKLQVELTATPLKQ